MIAASRIFIMAAAASGTLAVILGAFGAHALKTRLEPEALQAFETGVRYQMYHTLALLFIAWLLDRNGSPWLASSGWAFVIGIVLFSGSLYILATRSLHGMAMAKAWGLVTPLGGLAFIAGWISLLVAAIRMTGR